MSMKRDNRETLQMIFIKTMLINLQSTFTIIFKCMQCKTNSSIITLKKYFYAINPCKFMFFKWKHTFLHNFSFILKGQPYLLGPPPIYLGIFLKAYICIIYARNSYHKKCE